MNATAWLATIRTEAAARDALRAEAAKAAAAAVAPKPAAKKDKAACAPAQKSGKSAVSSPKKAAQPKAAAKSSKAVSLEGAKAQFDKFARNWVGSISRNLRHTAADMDVVPDGGATVVARFMEVDHDSLEMQVKPSSSGGSACPFVGVLRYQEHHYESRAASEVDAKDGPFTRVKTMRVTEIFRYVSGRWTN